MTRGTKSQYYDYRKVESLADLVERNGCDTMVYRTWMRPFFDGDLLMTFADEDYWTDELGRKHLMNVDVETINRIKTHYLNDLRSAARWATKLLNSFCDNDKVYAAFEQVNEQYEKALKKQRSMNSTPKYRLSWFKNRNPGMTFDDWLFDDEAPTTDFLKMNGKEYQQYIWTQMMHTVFTRKFKKLCEIVIRESIERGKKAEVDEFRINEFNRLTAQTRSEQERKYR